MTSHLHAALVFVHLGSAIVWLGGMVFAHFALRPAAMQLLEPPARLALMAGALGRFFRLVAVAVLAILLSGWLLLARVRMSNAPVGWHLMFALGLVMAAIFVFICARLYPVLSKAVAEQQWQAAAGSLNLIRSLVFVNMWLGFLAVASAVSARA